jgi:hypothetical protein
VAYLQGGCSRYIKVSDHSATSRQSPTNFSSLPSPHPSARTKPVFIALTFPFKTLESTSTETTAKRTHVGHLKQITTALSKTLAMESKISCNADPHSQIIRYRENTMFFCFALRDNDIHSALSLFVLCKGSYVSKVLLAFR